LKAVISHDLTIQLDVYSEAWIMWISVSLLSILLVQPGQLTQLLWWV